MSYVTAAIIDQQIEYFPTAHTTGNSLKVVSQQPSMSRAVFEAWGLGTSGEWQIKWANPAIARIRTKLADRMKEIREYRELQGNALDNLVNLMQQIVGDDVDGWVEATDELYG